jgi:hypothetical protein
VTVDDFARLADGKIRTDKASGSAELPLAAFHPPDHRAVAQFRIGARAEVALPDGVEAQLMIVLAESDRARLHERTLTVTVTSDSKAALPCAAG